MIGKLTPDQIELVLRSQTVGRIGCADAGRVYVVPVTYAYDDGYVYMHSREGLKLEMMRRNPAVCFEVDQIDNLSAWRSVIAWGKFEELATPKAQKSGMKILTERLSPYIGSTAAHHPSSQFPGQMEKGLKAIVFRIQLTERSGRFEKQG